MSGNNRIQLPNQVQVEVRFAPGPNAEQVIAQFTSPTAVKFLVTGGETKVERHAVALLAGMLANPKVVTDAYIGGHELAVLAIDMAERLEVVLAERAKQETETEKTNDG